LRLKDLSMDPGRNCKQITENNASRSLSYNKVIYLTMYWKVRLRYVWMPQYLAVPVMVSAALSEIW
jgi:hypothetical protein